MWTPAWKGRRIWAAALLENVEGIVDVVVDHEGGADRLYLSMTGCLMHSLMIFDDWKAS